MYVGPILHSDKLNLLASQMPYIFLNQLGEYGRENHAENINYIPEESKDSFLDSFIGNREISSPTLSEFHKI
ncbi:Uncharacterised protein [Legionella israelensis]|uniref:Uncharacterized protein n=1 Tax=Legionella israelensis TaxID=454 RepID=A0A0W0V514_9GAMM|nr:hypothetical protein Lisr_2279 [Legionella israelensis]SCY24031.1 hypothetical protein SAMN02746069_01756 [Legionella israelensis DSM 19235]STX60525.1 Uncharacterised protein [Legionella israelensis]